LLVYLRPESLTVKAHSQNTIAIYLTTAGVTCHFNQREENSYLHQVKDPNGNLIYDSDSRPWYSSTEIHAEIDGVYTFGFRNDSDDDLTVTFSYSEHFGLLSMTNSQRIILFTILLTFCILVVIGVWWQSERTYDKYEMTAYDWDKEGEKKRKHR
jgi:hypothetical protein